MAEDSGPCGEEQEEIKSWILSRIQAAREEGGLGAVHTDLSVLTGALCSWSFLQGSCVLIK